MAFPCFCFIIEWHEVRKQRFPSPPDSFWRCSYRFSLRPTNMWLWEFPYNSHELLHWRLMASNLCSGWDVHHKKCCRFMPSTHRAIQTLTTSGNYEKQKFDKWQFLLVKFLQLKMGVTKGTIYCYHLKVWQEA